MSIIDEKKSLIQINMMVDNFIGMTWKGFQKSPNVQTARDLSACITCRNSLRQCQKTFMK